MDDDTIIKQYYEKLHNYSGLLKDLNFKTDELEIKIDELRKLINELYIPIKKIYSKLKINIRIFVL